MTLDEEALKRAARRKFAAIYSDREWDTVWGESHHDDFIASIRNDVGLYFDSLPLREDAEKEAALIMERLKFCIESWSDKATARNIIAAALSRRQVPREETLRQKYLRLMAEAHDVAQQIAQGPGGRE